MIWEANVFQCYPLWAIRCNLCASRLVELLPDKEKYSIDIQNQQDTFVEKFIWSFVLFPTFSEYCEKLSARPEKARSVAALCFEHSDTGRRPHIIKDEEFFYIFFKRGYNLAEEYVNSTQNYDAFQEWFRFLDPIHIEQILEMVEDCDGNDYYLHEMLEDTLVKQLVLLGRWMEGDTISFVEYWKSTGIIKVLELVDDNVFYATLRTLSKVKSNSDVRAVFEYYINDDESSIRSFAKRLLDDYDMNNDM